MGSSQFKVINGIASADVMPSIRSGSSRSKKGAQQAALAFAFAVAVVLSMLMTGLAVATSPDLSRASTVEFLQDEPPQANAGGNITTYEDETVFLNGSGSTGFEGAENLNYTWDVLYQTKTTTYYGMWVNISFPNPGGSSVNLTVRDSQNRTSSDTIDVVILERPPTFLDKYLMTIVIAAIVGSILGYMFIVAIMRIRAGQPVVSEARREKVRVGAHRYWVITKKVFRNPMGFIGLIILIFFGLMAIFGPYITPYDVKKQDPANSLMLPSKDHWLGTDLYGIDIFSELLYGARTSILVGTVSAIIASFLGAAVGLYSGYVGGWKDEVVMRLNDIVLSIPWLVLMIIVAAFVGKIDLTGIILIIGLTGWSYTARMVRAQVLSVKERQYIERARSIGASEMSIIRRHIFPNTFPLIFANTILTVAVSILSESTLSFLGMRPSDEVTWGTMLSFASESSAFQTGRQWWIIAPGMCIVIVVLGFTLLGYALDEILNPKLRRR